MSARVATHPFTAGMDHEQLALLTDCAMCAHFKEGDVIIREGQPANRFYLIESGKVVLLSSMEHEQPLVVDTIGAGDLLGWSWIFPPHIWHFTARATEDTEAIFFCGELLRRYCERNHSLGYALFKRMSAVMIKRLQAAREKMLLLHAGEEKLPPAIGLSPFMEQELETDDYVESKSSDTVKLST
ncbi:MAG TPA: cyclic nucleotide-binding domain-containing protein [Pyrinomonadaceae bacterium]|nr:cyclic nucleotide-binding domain-containing protein [Pyrinomonadaceae bacterium]